MVSGASWIKSDSSLILFDCDGHSQRLVMTVGIYIVLILDKLTLPYYYAAFFYTVKIYLYSLFWLLLFGCLMLSRFHSKFYFSLSDALSCLQCSNINSPILPMTRMDYEYQRWFDLLHGSVCITTLRCSKWVNYCLFWFF